MSPACAADRAGRGVLRPFTVSGGVRAMFTARHGGVSTGPYGTLNLSQAVGDDPAAVARNRSVVLAATAPGPSRLALMHQVHGAAVHYAPAEPEPAADGRPADAVFTDSPAVVLGVLAADCAPVLIGDPAAGLVGAAHAGRPGLVAGVVPALVAAMCEAGADAARMHAVIGPAICGGCYEVPAAMRDQVAAAAPGSGCVTRNGTPGIDVRAGVLRQLAGLGVSNVDEDRRCTAESADLFSYRRDGRTGRFAGLVWLAP
jgi:polyphenol oxidase